MKALKLIISGVLLSILCTIQAQIVVNVKIDPPPPWGPAGYGDVQFYYLPDIQSYYDVHSSMFIYSEEGVWIHRKYLPRQYRSYDLYNGYKVVMVDYRGMTPYKHFAEHRAKYGKGYRGPTQMNIGKRPGRGNSQAKAGSGRSGQGKGKSSGMGKNSNKK